MRGNDARIWRSGDEEEREREIICSHAHRMLFCSQTCCKEAKSMLFGDSRSTCTSSEKIYTEIRDHKQNTEVRSEEEK